MRRLIVWLILFFFGVGGGAHAQQPSNPSLQEKVAAIKQAVAANQQALHQYQWIETAQVSVKGEVKSTKQSSCLYGNDGKVQKTPLTTPPPPKQQSLGRRGRIKEKIVENKKEEMTDYMDQVKDLIGLYVPPDRNRLEMAYLAGNASLNRATTSGVTSLVVKNYAQPGDSLIFSFDEAKKKLTNVSVNTYQDDPKNAVTLSIEFASLSDGTNFPGKVVLVATAKQIKVDITNSNYHKIGQ